MFNHTRPFSEWVVIVSLILAIVSYMINPFLPGLVQMPAMFIIALVASLSSPDKKLIYSFWLSFFLVLVIGFIGCFNEL